MEPECQDVGEGCLPGRGGLKRGYHHLPREVWEMGTRTVSDQGFRAEFRELVAVGLGSHTGGMALRGVSNPGVESLRGGGGLTFL